MSPRGSPWHQGWDCWHHVTVSVFRQDLPLPLQMLFFPFYHLRNPLKPFAVTFTERLGCVSYLWALQFGNPSSWSLNNALIVLLCWLLGLHFYLKIVLITYDSNLQDSLTHWWFSVEVILILVPGPSDLPWLHQDVPDCFLPVAVDDLSLKLL